jgi:hypothetical protein
MPENKLTVFISREENTAARRNDAAPVSLMRLPRKIIFSVAWRREA